MVGGTSFDGMFTYLPKDLSNIVCNYIHNNNIYVETDKNNIKHTNCIFVEFNCRDNKKIKYGPFLIHQFYLLENFINTCHTLAKSSNNLFASPYTIAWFLNNDHIDFVKEVYNNIDYKNIVDNKYNKIIESQLNTLYYKIRNISGKKYYSEVQFNPLEYNIFNGWLGSISLSSGVLCLKCAVAKLSF